MNRKTPLLYGGTLVVSIAIGVAARGLSSGGNTVMASPGAIPPVCDMKIEDGDGTRVYTEVQKVPEALLARMPFATADAAKAFIQSNGKSLAGAFQALAPHLGARFQDLRRCLGYDTQPHRLSKLHVRWNLTASERRLQASGFVLERVEGEDRQRIEPCFNRSFATAVKLDGVPEPAALLSYRGVAPSLLTFNL
jgi:hypothetical protein